MGKIILNDQEVEVEDNEPIVDAIEELGVPIGCSNGVCGTCEVEVLSGMEHLNPVNEEEEDLGMEGNRRLGCQLCVKDGGTVTMTF
jgi:ferredoxin